jgi:DegV family protein with EDD domain
MAFRIVTDSSSCLPAGWAAAHDVTVIPQRFLLDGVPCQDGGHLSTDEFYRRLEAGAISLSSQPGPDEFRSAYEQASADDAEVISIHIGAGLSGTLDLAYAVASGSRLGRVQVVDSRSAGLGLGFLVMEAARMQAEGAHVVDVLAAIEDMILRTKVYFLLHTVKYLVHGGRVGRAAGVAASLLRVRPILTFTDGATAVVARARTKSAAETALWRLVKDSASRGLQHVGLHYGLDPSEAEMWSRRLAELYGVETVTTQLSPAVGAHSGPSILGVVLVEDSVRAV